MKTGQSIDVYNVHTTVLGHVTDLCERWENRAKIPYPIFYRANLGHLFSYKKIGRLVIKSVKS